MGPASTLAPSPASGTVISNSPCVFAGRPSDLRGSRLPCGRERRLFHFDAVLSRRQQETVFFVEGGQGRQAGGGWYFELDAEAARASCRAFWWAKLVSSPASKKNC